jgi:hypothetical protein
MDLDDITTSDPALVAAFGKFTTRVHASENFSFWFDKGNNEGKYAKYIKHGAPKELTLDNSALVKEFNTLAAAGKYNDMNPQFVKARAEVQNMLAGRMNEFSNSKEHDDYVLVKKAGNVTKALKLLGVTGAQATTMTTLLKEYAVGTESERKATLAKMEKIAKHDQLIATLKSSGLV